MSTSAHQNSAEALAQLTWENLHQVFDLNITRRPPLYFFLSPQSKGSLKGRSLYEIDLVHRQQFLGEGITLKFPPASWVSSFDQIPEETGHLFALCHQPSTKYILNKRRPDLTESQELWSMALHECFGKFASHLVLGLKMRWAYRPRAKKLDLWEAAHREGYYLGGKLAEAYFDEKISERNLKKFFRMNWYADKKPVALNFLYSILDETPANSYFGKSR